jgi:chromosome segregation protein
MQFTRLRLTGFKSFVDPTELVIAEGLTGVVGPNGCGKSNLLEALRWVMGETRASAMRGDGMEDVIFAGSASRPARHHAEVMLAIDNADRLAPAGLNDADVLEVVRRITRDAGSAYRLNGKDLRARDVQMLFADASTGAHSPALVRQGQISELINARPKARRRVLEEAAGISGLYQRRHEAELKLTGAEGNLSRVADVLEGLDVQLRGLERQAKAAQRYREIAADLRHAEGVLLYRRWREAEDRRAAAAAALDQAVRAAGLAEGEASARARARLAAEAALPPLREEDAIAGAVLQRLLVERETEAAREAEARRAIAGLTDRIAQLGRDAEREAALTEDAGATMARLAAEAEGLQAAEDGHDARLAGAQEAARAADAVLAEAEAALDRLTGDAARLAARHQSAERRVTELAQARERLMREIAAARAEGAALAGQVEAAAGRMAAAVAAETDARDRAGAAEAALAGAEAARAAAQVAEGEARAALAGATGEMQALVAELSALRRLADRDRGSGAQLLDRVRADRGHEAALGAALADDLKAPVLGDAAGSGWRALPGYDVAPPLPGGVQPLSAHVEAPDLLARRLGQTGLVARRDGDRLQAALLPGQRLVSAEGDLWRWDGLRQVAGDGPSSAALRLQQKNRLAELEAAAAAAEAVAADRKAAHAGAKAALDAAQADEARARAARREADHAAAEAGRALTRAEADKVQLAGRAEALAAGLARREADATEAAGALSAAEAERAGLGDLAGLQAAVADGRSAVEAARLAMIARRSAAAEMRRDGEARARRLAEIARERDGWTARQANAEARVAELDRRAAEARARLAEAEGQPAAIALRLARLADGIAAAEARRGAAGDALARAEGALREAEGAERQAERAASEAREARARAGALAEAAGSAVDEAAARIADEMEVTPDGLLAALAVDPADMPAADAAEAEVHRLRRAREALGAVNLRAEEDAREVASEIATLAAEKADLEEAISRLRAAISSLNREGRGRLVAAFEQVNRNFAALFRHLFGGGEANLVLVESDDPLEAGLEIMCQPPGKKLSTLSLLSGGEQTLTALSLIFAVFLANPSPICVLDEVDAPLDDANVTRFCDLLDEMKRRTGTRFLIITHHAVTMARMDRLFGVTMAEQGVSQLVSVDLQRAGELVEG